VGNKKHAQITRQWRLWLLAGLLIFAAGCRANTASSSIGEGTPQPTAGRVQAIMTRIVGQIAFATSTPAPLATPVRVEPLAILDISLIGQLPDLDPGLAERQSQLDLTQNLFAGLTNFNPETNSIEPELASTWAVSDDGRTWTFNLRDDIYWVRPKSPGPGSQALWSATQIRPVTAEDVVYAVQRYCSRQVTSAATFSLFLIEGCEAVYAIPEPVEADLKTIGIEAVNPTLLQVRLTKPAGFFLTLSQGLENPLGTQLCLIPVGLTILSLVLINAQGVTSLTSERDTGALDLLLVTELSPAQFIYGKLYGVLYNAKEMVALPVLAAIYLWWADKLGGENLFFFIIDYLLFCHFAAMLGLHSAISFTSSRTAVANSLGTIFFLMVGILLCAYLIIQSDREFGRQLLSFMIFIGAGSVALFGSMGAKNPSRAIALVAILTPFCSFYCIISLLNGDFLAALLVSAGVYGFALMAMLVPAVGDFDIALGRTNAIQG